jgi:hypothetical protein
MNMKTQNTFTFTVGQKVTSSGFPGVVVRQYSENMYEVRLPGGLVCVSSEDIKPEGQK